MLTVASPTPRRGDNHLSAKFILFPTFRARGMSTYMGTYTGSTPAVHQVSARLPFKLRQVNTPLQWCEWDSSLATHPDQQFRAYYCDRSERGVQSGRLASNQGDPARNMPSTRERPEVVIDDYLAKECSKGKGRVLGPLSPALFPSVHTSRFMGYS